jgi:hypothetical protein
MPTYVNQDGLEVRFGADIGKRGFKAGVTTGAGKRRELVLDVDLKALGANGTGFTADLNNDGTPDGFNPSNTALPINVRIDKVSAVVIQTPAGGTSYQLGTFLENGTAVDDDGLLTTAGAQGAQVGTMSGSSELFVAPKVVGTYTAGRIKFVVEYVTQ